jgi:hypothetical protein
VGLQWPYSELPVLALHGPAVFSTASRGTTRTVRITGFLARDPKVCPTDLGARRPPDWLGTC